MADSQRMAVLAVTLVFGAALFFTGITMLTDPLEYYSWMLSARAANLLGPLVMFVGFLMTFGALVAFLMEKRTAREKGEEPEATYFSPPLSILDRPPKPTPPPDLFFGVEPKPKIPQDLHVPIVAPQPPACPHLIGLTGGLPNKVEIPPGRFTIGRDHENDLVLASQLVSRHHAELEWDGETLVVRDLGSGNTTRVNDQTLSAELALQDGDVIQIVDYNLEVELPPSLSRTVILPRGGMTQSSE